jgi:hypothetical protein
MTSAPHAIDGRGMLIAKPAPEAFMHLPTVGQRLIVRTLPLLLSAVLLALGCTPVPKVATPAAAPRPDLSPLWEEPADIAARDLYSGPGGPELMPPPNSAPRTVTSASTRRTGGTRRSIATSRLRTYEPALTQAGRP